MANSLNTYSETNVWCFCLQMQSSDSHIRTLDGKTSA